MTRRRSGAARPAEFVLVHGGAARAHLHRIALPLGRPLVAGDLALLFDWQHSPRKPMSQIAGIQRR
jgi:hypothetical protein